MKKRVFSVLLAVCIILSGFAGVTANGAFYCTRRLDQSDSAEINRMLDSIATQAHSDPTAAQARAIIRHFVYDSDYAAINGGRFTYTNAYGRVNTINDGTYTRSGINASGCFAYAKFVSLVMYDAHDGTQMYSDYGESAGNATVETVRNLIEKYAQAGEHLAIGTNVHSVAYCSHDANGFWYMDFYWDNDPYIRLCYVTYSEMANQLNGVGNKKGAQRLSLYNVNTLINGAAVIPEPEPELIETMFTNERALSLYSVKCTRAQAKAYCEEYGGVLAGVSDPIQQDELSEMVTDFGSACWMGGYYSGGWKWLSGADFVFSNWSDSSPDTDEYTVMLAGTSNGKWSTEGSEKAINGFLMEAPFKELKVTKLPNKTVYLPGEDADYSGLVISAVYADGSKNAVALADLIISGFDSSSCREIPITAVYGGKSVTFNVTVTHTHEFSGIYTEEIHPHKQYSQCSCGEIKYINNGSYVGECPECSGVYIVFGDVNLDEDITTDDARLTLRYAVGLEVLDEQQILAADVDGEPGVTTSDARLILRYVVGLDNLYIYQ